MFTAFLAIVAGAIAIAALRKISGLQEDVEQLRIAIGHLQRASRGSVGAADAPVRREPEPVATKIEEPAGEAPAAPTVVETPAPPPPSMEPPPPVTPPPPAAPPRKPFDWESLVGVKLFSWIAGISLVLAAVFFLKYSVEHGWLSPTVRATIGLLTGVSLLVVCEMRIARDVKFTANALHGAGIAILYATLFAMHALWHLAPAGVVFFLMLIVTAVAVGLSIRRDSIFIALLGLMGGFSTPALLSTGENRPIGLFAYLLLLNLGLAWVAFKKRWPLLTFGSLAFTVIYQWGWIAKYLTPSQLPIAVTIFVVFAVAGVAALWVSRDENEARQRWFERTAVASAALPIAFAVFAAAVPAYGARYNTLFGFLAFVAAGLAFISWKKAIPWLHNAGGAAVLLTFLIWTTRSYTPLAWPVVLAWLALFVALYLFVASRTESLANYTAPLLFFVFPAVLALESRTEAPALLFATMFVLLAATAFVAVRYNRGILYFIASFFAIVTEGAWAAKHLTSDRLYAGLAIFGAFGLLFLAVPAVARYAHRRLTPRHGTAGTVILSLVLLLFLTGHSIASFALWGLALLLAVLLTGAIVEARAERRAWLAAVAIVLSWIVLASWWEAAPLGAALIPALFVIAVFGIIALVGTAWAARGGQDASFASSSHLALAGHLFLIFVAVQPSLAFPPWPFLAVLAVLDLAAGVASLYLRRGSLMLGSAIASQVVLLAWTSIQQAAPWPNVALAATLIVAAWAMTWHFLGRRLTHDKKFTSAAIAALLLGHVVAIGAGASAKPPLFTTLLIAHALLVIGALAIAWLEGMHVLAIVSAVFAAMATLGAETQTPGQQALFAFVPYALYIAYAFAAGARRTKSIHPHLAAVVASGAFFFFAHDAMTDAGYGWMIGVLPVAQALVLLALLVQLIRVEAAGERLLARLALVAGASLAFITAAIPLQLEKQWITIAWALEAAALIWLFRRIPHRGLLLWSAGLFAAVFARLTFNPAVFSYHPASHAPIFNWYLYTYLVSALAFFGAAILLPREMKNWIGAASTLGTILLFWLLNIEIADFYSTGTSLTFNFFSSSLAEDLSYTIGWALFAIAMLVAGIALRVRSARVAALVLLLVTILKCFLHDLARLGGLYRVGSLLGLALSLVVVGVLLQKFVMAKAMPVQPEESAS